MDTDTWDGMIERVVEEVEQRGEVHRQWNVLKGWASRQRSTQAQREDLVDQLDARGLSTYPLLSAVNPASKDKVRIFPTADRHKHFGLRFATEKDFEDTIVQGFERIEQLQGVSVVEKQYRLPDNKRIDVLGRRRKHWVVIEVERTHGHMETPTQVLGYVERLRKVRLEDGTLLVREHHDVEAIVISQADSPDSRAALAAVANAHGFSATWMVLKIDFDSYELA